MKTVILKIVIKKHGNAIPLSVDQHRRIPCYSLSSYEFEEKLFQIEYNPQSGVTEAAVIQEHLISLHKKFKIHRFEILK
ncbi:hypothetical protein [Persicobacter psychrovividus]|uniref:Uncharacterized protein n=1 Tax=Persicobacter psychrovividus TaxID=387638 RepID=A0ABM7VE77_9BACT|nr:hypothetical protein PEPS_15440 [Persicobacter psychrovividus]